MEDPAVLVFYENFYENGRAPSCSDRTCSHRGWRQTIAAAASELLDGGISVVPLRRIA